MSTEKTHGKPSTRLPRAKGLRPAEGAATARERRRSDRDEHGRASVGNTLAKGRGWKRAVDRMLGHDGAELTPTSAAVAEDAWRVLTATVRELPHDGPTVRGLAASLARHRALEAFWSARALAVGLDTPEGIAAQEHATKHGQRAERLAVTALDVARVLAAHDRQRPQAQPWWLTAPTPSTSTPSTPAELEDDQADDLDADDEAEETDPPEEGTKAAPRERGEPSGISTTPTAPPSPAAHYDPPPVTTRPLAREVATIPTGIGLPPMAEPEWVYSPAHGRLMPRGEARDELPRASPPAGLDAQLARLRQQADLDALKNRR